MLDQSPLTVSDRERSAAFYGEHFGLTERVHDDAHRLILGDGEGSLLALSHGDPRGGLLPHDNHFGFRLPTAEDVLAARERFRAAGVEEAEFQEPRPARVMVRDPDGYPSRSARY